MFVYFFWSQFYRKNTQYLLWMSMYEYLKWQKHVSKWRKLLNCCNEMGLMTWPYQRVHLACSCSVLSLYSLAPSTGRRNLMTSALLKFGSLMGAAPALPIPSTIASQIPLEGAPQSNRLASSFNRWIIDRKEKIDSHNKENMQHTARELSFLKGYGNWLSWHLRKV